MTVGPLILKRASASRLSGEWNDDDFDVRPTTVASASIMKVHAAPEGTPWVWTLAFGQHEDRTPTHGYEPTREAAMAAFAKGGGGSERRGQAGWWLDSERTAPVKANQRLTVANPRPRRHWASKVILATGKLGRGRSQLCISCADAL
jgi:hypothetical protein